MTLWERYVGHRGETLETKWTEGDYSPLGYDWRKVGECEVSE